MSILKKTGYLCSIFIMASMGMSLVASADTEADTEVEEDTVESSLEEAVDIESEEFQRFQMVPLMAPDTRGLPPIPGDSEVLTNVFRDPIGTGPSLLTDKILRITPAINGQKGAVWSKNKIDLKRNFKLRAYLYLGNSKSKAADGITFTLQNDGRMASDPDSVIGDSGMGLAAYSNNKGGAYVRNAISIEFDTYYNGSGGDVMDNEIGANGKRGHIAFVTPKPNNNNSSGEHSGVTKPTDYLSNGEWRKIVFNWDAKTKVLSYDLENVGSGSHTINLENQFDGHEVYWGFTASTGGFNAENAVAISELPQNFEQEPTVENKTNNTAKVESVEAVKGNEVILETTIKRSPFSDVDEYKNSTIRVNINKGLTPKLTEIKINNSTVADNRISYSNGILKIKKVNLSPSGSDVISVPCNVTITSVDHSVTLENFFELITASGNIVSTSTSVFVEIPEAGDGEVKVYYIKRVDGVDVELHETKTISGQIGTAYTAEKLVIPDHVWVATEGDVKGKIAEPEKGKEQKVTFIYEPIGTIEIISVPKLIDFGEILVTDYQERVGADKTNVDEPFVVEDTRRIKEKWEVTAEVTQELTNDSNPSKVDVQTGALRYYYKGNEITLNAGSKTIYSNAATSSDKEFNISDSWGKGDAEEGLKLKIDSNRVPNTTGSYIGKIKWTLRSTVE